MGALCSADTTAMTACRLFMSHSFWEATENKQRSRLGRMEGYGWGSCVCVCVCTLAVRMYRLNTSALIFNVCAWRISRTTQKLVCREKKPPES